MVPEESLPIDAVRLCFEPKFLSDEKIFEDLLDGSVPVPVVVVAVVSEAILLTVRDGVGVVFGGETSVEEDDDDDDDDDEEDSGGWLVVFSVGGISDSEG